MQTNKVVINLSHVIEVNKNKCRTSTYQSFPSGRINMQSLYFFVGFGGVGDLVCTHTHPIINILFLNRFRYLLLSPQGLSGSLGCNIQTSVLIVAQLAFGKSHSRAMYQAMKHIGRYTVRIKVVLAKKLISKTIAEKKLVY